MESEKILIGIERVESFISQIGLIENCMLHFKK